MTPDAAAALLPHELPDSEAAQLLLYGMRRMAAGGLHDAHAAHTIMLRFGIGFRRPLLLLRATMLEMSRTATRKLLLAPCCCPRLTDDEAALLGLLARAGDDAPAAHVAMARLLGVSRAPAAFSAAHALAAACEDMGRPLDR